MNQKSLSGYIPRINKIYELNGIPLCICNTEGSSLYHCPQTKGLLWTGSFLSYGVSGLQQRKWELYQPFVTVLEPDIFVGMIQLEPDLYLALGPVASSRLDLNAVIAVYGSISMEYLQELCDLLAKTPLFTYRRFVSALSLIVGLFHGKELSCEEIILSNDPARSETTEYHSRRFPYTNPDTSLLLPDNFLLENQVCQAIEKGDLHELEEAFSCPADITVSQMADTPLLQSRYAFIAFITLVIRAAIRGGMPQEAAFHLGNVYCRKMNSLTSLSGINALFYRMAQEFCTCVNSARSDRSSSLIARKCRNYILAHLNETIRAEDLATLCGVSTRTISMHFKKDFAMSVPEYINREKLKEAQYLLAHSSLSLSGISHDLQFNSQSYFTKVFREAFGLTPQQYRNHHQDC